jgi:hypothetical protein
LQDLDLHYMGINAERRELPDEDGDEEPAG